MTSTAVARASAQGAVDTTAARTQQMAEGVVRLLLTSFAEPLTVADMAAACGMSRFKFCRDFSAAFGASPMRWLWVFRGLLAAEFMLLEAEWPLTDIAFACGFNSSAHFSRTFKSIFRESPSAYRERSVLSEQTPGVSSVFGDNAAAVRSAAHATFARVAH